MRQFIVILPFALFLACFSVARWISAAEPVRFALAGLSHSHVHGFLNKMQTDDWQLVGIAEKDRALAERLAKRYGFEMALVDDDLETMLDKAKPQGVLAFNSIFDHLAVVEACAPRGIHVMVEKPLAVNGEHARKMATLAERHRILVLTNYETTWYPTNRRAFEWAVEEKRIGPVRKMIICDGHKGPREIGVNKEFLDWLADPVGNGGGAVIDFGCYGANLATQVMQNRRPVSVLAMLQQFKPNVYPKVDDEATIILAYPESQAVIQASWNWPFNRKDMEIYGTTGYVKAINAKELYYRFSERETEKREELSSASALQQSPFIYFAAVVRGDVKVRPTDLSSLENNLIVMEILDAARESARTGKAIQLAP